MNISTLKLSRILQFIPLRCNIKHLNWSRILRQICSRHCIMHLNWSRILKNIRSLKSHCQAFKIKSQHSALSFQMLQQAMIVPIPIKSQPCTHAHIIRLSDTAPNGIFSRMSSFSLILHDPAMKVKALHSIFAAIMCNLAKSAPTGNNVQPQNWMLNLLFDDGVWFLI